MGAGAVKRAFVAAALLAAAAAHAQEPPAVLLVGDSTMAPRTGYGEAFCARLAPELACLNLARGGRSTLSYRAEGLWDRLLARLRAGAPGVQRHVLIQFGHNDQPGKPGRSTDLATEYPQNLARMVAEVKATGAVPVLVTPLTRRSFRGAELNNDLVPWAEAMRRVAAEQGVLLLDLNARSAAAVQAMGGAEADRLAMAPPPAAGEAPLPGFDRTHVGARGACVFADQLAQLVIEQLPALRASVRAGRDCNAVAPEPASPPPVRLNRSTWDSPGWAVGTLGGKGGRLLRVTNLNESGPGSLRAAVEASGPRLIVFEVGGVIDMGGKALDIRNPFVTIAGQTAPHPGITLIKGETHIDTHDVIVQHLMFRPGEWGRPKKGGGDQDGISTRRGAFQVIVDHCSFSWATDENLSASGPRFDGPDVEAWRRATSHNLTFSHNLVYEGLAESVHEKGEHSKGTLVHDNVTGLLLYGNLYASNRERNALFKGGVQAAMVNNLVFNPGAKAVHYNLVAHEWEGRAPVTGRIALVGNVLRHGPDTRAGVPLFALGGAGDVELWLQDNRAVDFEGKPIPFTGSYTQGQARILNAATANLPPDLRVLPVQRLEDELPLAVGARPWDRDPIDFKLLSDVAEGRGQIIDSERQNAHGHPRYKATQRAFDPAQWNLSDMSPKAGWASLFGATPRP